MKIQIAPILAFVLATAVCGEQAETDSNHATLANDSYTFTLTPEPPEEIATILEAKTSPTAMIRELDRLNADEWKTLLEDEAENMISHQINGPLNTFGNDFYYHKIYYNLKTQVYWIVRTGGYFGVYQIYGPGRLD